MGASKKRQAMTSVGRVLLLSVIFGIATMALMGEPHEDSNRWFEEFIASKAIAAVGFVAFWMLYARWCKTDKWLKAYNKRCNEALEAANRTYVGKEVSYER